MAAQSKGSTRPKANASDATAGVSGSSGRTVVGRDRVPIAARVMVIVVVLVLAGHFAATFVWNTTPNAFRQVIGQGALQAYMIPMFGQSWSVFAPNPGSVNPDLQVRATVSQGGKTTVTGWYSMTDRDASVDVQLHPIPSRMYLNDFIFAERYYDAALALPVPVRNQAAPAYLGEGWSGALQRKMTQAGGSGDAAVITAYMRYERAAIGLASEVARAHWGPGVVQVQVRVLETPVVPFAQRGQKVTEASNYFADGWRAYSPVAGTDTSTFDSMFGPKAAS